MRAKTGRRGRGRCPKPASSTSAALESSSRPQGAWPPAVVGHPRPQAARPWPAVSSSSNKPRAFHALEESGMTDCQHAARPLRPAHGPTRMGGIAPQGRPAARARGRLLARCWLVRMTIKMTRGGRLFCCPHVAPLSDGGSLPTLPNTQCMCKPFNRVQHVVPPPTEEPRTDRGA